MLIKVVLFGQSGGMGPKYNESDGGGLLKDNRWKIIHFWSKLIYYIKLVSGGYFMIIRWHLFNNIEITQKTNYTGITNPIIRSISI